VQPEGSGKLEKIHLTSTMLNKDLLDISRAKCRLLVKHILIPETLITNIII
jgi:hypothetical protein